MQTYRRGRSTRLLVIGLIVTSLVTITVDFRGGDEGPLAAVGRIGASIVTPLQEGVSAAFRPVGSFVSTFFRAGSIKEENDRLAELVEQFTAQVQFVYALEAENQRYRDILGLGARLDYQLFGATVVGGSFNNFEWAIQIDKGSDDGVYEDMAVVTGLGLVGRVVKVTPSGATVMLIIDPSSSVAVRLGGSRELAILEGQGAEELRVDLVDPEAVVEPLERVVTASFRLDGVREGVLPPELPVGVVSRVVPGDPGQGPTVYVKPSVDFSTLDYVALVRPSQGPPVQPQE